jgi:hypothetical protein
MRGILHASVRTVSGSTFRTGPPDAPQVVRISDLPLVRAYGTLWETAPQLGAQFACGPDS